MNTLLVEFWRCDLPLIYLVKVVLRNHFWSYHRETHNNNNKQTKKDAQPTHN